MNRIITALGNPVLNNELKRYEKYDVICDDLQYQEAVFDVLENEQTDTIILSGLLQGQSEFLEFALQVKKKNISSRIIVIVDSIEDEDKNILYSKGIFDIFYDDAVSIENIIDAIDRDEPISKINILNEIKEPKYDIKEEREIIKNINVVQKQEVIAVFGISGSGKSTIAANLAKNLVKRTDSKVLLIDLDTLNGNIDEILGINKIPTNVEILIDEDKKCGLNYVADLVKKNRFDTNVLEELVVKCGKLDVITGNTSLHSCQNILDEQCYERLINSAKEKYDFIILDTSSNIFLDSTKWSLQTANRILFVAEDSYVCLKKATQLLDVVEKLWGIWKDKIELVINKVNSENIGKEVIEKILNLELISSIKQNNQDLENEYEKILRKINYIPKITIKDRVDKAVQSILDPLKKGMPQIINKGEIEHAN